MNKHTPGPWEIVKLDHGIVVRTESPNKTKYGASRYACIGGFDRTDPEQLAEAIANAQLIAAAPDLLEALDTMAHHFGPLEDNEMLSSDVRRVFKMARDAISKARGEQ